MATKRSVNDTTVVRLDNFIRATRDSGYKGTTAAIAELVDNSLQAGATEVSVVVERSNDEADPWLVMVIDNGSGMDTATLTQALRFGGSTRFGDRSGTGRYGMGLPNASLSQAQRLEVFTWQKPKKLIMSYLDVAEIAEGKLTAVPPPQKAQLDSDLVAGLPATGTIVAWSKCDRLDHKRASTIQRRLIAFLGRVFRYPIWSGVKITVNDELVRGIDPLHVHPASPVNSGVKYGDELVYEVASQASGESRVGEVHVRFAELPVEKWHALSSQEKRELGVTGQPVVSVVRGDREVDSGWFFVGKKRRENYDDWWRCEIRFDPQLDEMFGITHTKQQVRPTSALLNLLGEDIEQIARALNSRVRQKHASLKSASRVSEVEELAALRDKTLKPLSRPSRQRAHDFSDAVARSPALQSLPDSPSKGAVRYALRDDNIGCTAIYDIIRDAKTMVVLLNRAHPFFRKVYAPLAERDDAESQKIRHHLDLLVLAAARSEEVFTNRLRPSILRYREEWSKALAAYLKG